MNEETNTWCRLCRRRIFFFFFSLVTTFYPASWRGSYFSLFSSPAPNISMHTHTHTYTQDMHDFFSSYRDFFSTRKVSPLVALIITRRVNTTVPGDLINSRFICLSCYVHRRCKYREPMGKEGREGQLEFEKNSLIWGMAALYRWTRSISPYFGENSSRIFPTSTNICVKSVCTGWTEKFDEFYTSDLIEMHVNDAKLTLNWY